SAVGRGMLDRAAVDAVNDRVAELLGPFDTWQVCPHEPFAGCACRKPAPGLVLAAAAALGVPTTRCVVVGDIGADMVAAAAAGAAPGDATAVRGLVPDLAGRGLQEAIVFTSFHQSALPLALLLRMAGVATISAISDDYPGSLLDVRHRVPTGIPEAERALSL